MKTLVVPEFNMKKAKVTLKCPECNAPFTICTKGRAMDKKNNASKCKQCGAVFAIEDPDGNELNQPWTQPQSPLVAKILEMCRIAEIHDEQMAAKLDEAIAEYPEADILKAFERVLFGHENKPAGEHVIATALRSLRMHSATAAAQRSGEEDLQVGAESWLR